MSSTNKTTHYELPQFVDNDIFNPLVDDNDAYEKIDTALYNIANAEADNASEIVNVKSRMTSAEGAIDTLEAQNGTEVLTTVAQTLSGAVNELKGEEDSLDGRLDAVESDINNPTTGLKANVESLNTNLTHESEVRLENDNILSNEIDKLKLFGFMAVLKGADIEATYSAGDCIIFKTDNDKIIMVDTGATQSYDVIKEQLTDMGIEKIDYFILTHYHADHYGNIGSLVLDGFISSNTISYLPRSNPATVPDWGDEAYVRNTLAFTTIITIDSNEPLIVGSMKFDFFNCDMEDYNYYNTLGTDCNNYSVCSYVTFLGTTILLTGDIVGAAQEHLLSLNKIHKCDILKVPHHAIADGYADFYMAASAKYGVFTTHPSIFNDAVEEYVNVKYMNILGYEVVSNNTDKVLFGMTKGIYGLCASTNRVLSDYNTTFSIYVKAGDNGDGTALHPFNNLKEALAKALTLNNCKEVNVYIKGAFTCSDDIIAIASPNNILHIGGDKVENVNQFHVTGRVQLRGGNISISNVDFDYTGTAIAFEMYSGEFMVNGCNFTGEQLDSDFYNSRCISCNGATAYFNGCTISNKGVAVFVGSNGNFFGYTIKGVNNRCLAGGTGKAEFKNSTIAYTNITENGKNCEIIYNYNYQFNGVGEYYIYKKSNGATTSTAVIDFTTDALYKHALIEITNDNGDLYKVSRFDSALSTIMHPIVGTLDASQVCNITANGFELSIEHDKGVAVKVIPMP